LVKYLFQKPYSGLLNFGRNTGRGLGASSFVAVSSCLVSSAFVSSCSALATGSVISSSVFAGALNLGLKAGRAGLILQMVFQLLALPLH
jgi:hypothetical protein